MIDADATIERLYQEIDGFTVRGKDPNGRRPPPFGPHVYGEVTPFGVDQIASAAGLCPTDVFVDLGSGVGKVVLQIAMAYPGIRSIGVELDSERHGLACQALERAQAEKLVDAGRCELRHENMLKADLQSASVLFANSTCFSDYVMSRLVTRILALERPVTFVTFRRLRETRRQRLRLIETRSCSTSWNPELDMHVYRRDL